MKPFMHGVSKRKVQSFNFKFLRKPGEQFYTITLLITSCNYFINFLIVTFGTILDKG